MNVERQRVIGSALCATAIVGLTALPALAEEKQTVDDMNIYEANLGNFNNDEDNIEYDDIEYVDDEQEMLELNSSQEDLLEKMI